MCLKGSECLLESNLHVCSVQQAWRLRNSRRRCRRGQTHSHQRIACRHAAHADLPRVVHEPADEGSSYVGPVPAEGVTPAERLGALAASDFAFDNPNASGGDQLWSICEELQEQDDVLVYADDMFGLMERLDGVDLGSPGPLVHALEATGRDYEPQLVASLRRKPSRLTVWMVNRILNTDRADRESWLDLLSVAASHPVASEETQADARAFLARQVGIDHH